MQDSDIIPAKKRSGWAIVNVRHDTIEETYQAYGPIFEIYTEKRFAEKIAKNNPNMEVRLVRFIMPANKK